MPDYFKLLLNLEESIFHLIQKRDYSLKIFLDENKTNETKFDKSYIKANINFDLPCLNDIIDIYTEKYLIIPVDIDIINLIVKYISVCGKILKQEIIDLFGIKVLDYQPKQTIKYLDADYIINKYKGNYGWGIAKNVIETMQDIFLNIIIPFSSNYMLKIYAC